MPNWCNNVLELTHEDPAMITRAQNAAQRGELLNEFIPVPEDLKIISGFLGDTEEQKDLEAQEEVNLHKHGYRNWYDFCVNEWGTKWEVDAQDITVDRQDGTRLTLTFDSAWSPPIQAYEELMALGFVVKAHYYEPGMAYAGVWEDGSDDYYEYGGMNSDEIEDTLPVELDEMFCISQQVAEWEEENQEIDLDDGLSAINEQESHDE